MDIKVVEEVLGIYRALIAPRHVIITTEEVTQDVAKKCVGTHCQTERVRFMGLQPKSRGDVIILTPHGRPVTAIHETLHAQFGIGELLAYPLAELFIQKCKILKKFPQIRQLVKRNIKYEECSGCQEFAELHKDPRFIHYIKVEVRNTPLFRRGQDESK